ncbi:MAG: CoA pyrophosphatase [Candidatus Bathyarchaeota archaeon]|nr:CoA pyrophosphatase [Candidatus Bathyarchaeum sp.]
MAEIGYTGYISKLSEILNQSYESLNTHAAVVVLIRAAHQGFQLLIVKRAENAGDPWSGQTALPGGKRSFVDQNLKETVVRETLEETGINLHVGCRFLGAMEPLTSTQKPGIKILPFVVLQDKKQTISLNEELTEYFWAPLAEFAKNKGTVKFGVDEHPAYIIKSQVVWGLTYRILDKLLAPLYL